MACSARTPLHDPMKPRPHYDFPVGVWPESADYPNPTAEALSGVYPVTLNYVVSLVFVPTVDHRAPWPPELPQDVDHIESEADVRRMMIALSDLIVTPDDTRAGTIETPPQRTTPIILYSM